jgi:hypothetical protein
MNSHSQAAAPSRRASSAVGLRVARSRLRYVSLLRSKELSTSRHIDKEHPFVHNSWDCLTYEEVTRDAREYTDTGTLRWQGERMGIDRCLLRVDHQRDRSAAGAHEAVGEVLLLRGFGFQDSGRQEEATAMETSGCLERSDDGICTVAAGSLSTVRGPGGGCSMGAARQPDDEVDGGGDLEPCPRLLDPGGEPATGCALDHGDAVDGEASDVPSRDHKKIIRTFIAPFSPRERDCTAQP